MCEREGGEERREGRERERELGYLHQAHTVLQSD